MTAALCARAREALLTTVDEFAGAQDEPWTARVAAPQSDDWSLAPESLRFLVALIRHLEPRHVLEFGSGRSTAVLGRACADLPTPATLTAIENDPEYLERTSAAIAADGLEATVQVVPASLVARRCHERMVPVYLVDPRLVSRAPDLVLVDGPPQPLGGREGAMYQALQAAHAGTLIALDDSRREGEQAALTRSLRLYEGYIEAANLLGFPKGLAVLVVVEPVDQLGLPEDSTVALELSSRHVSVCPNPVFIIGSPRSGTTALARALAEHSTLWTSHESYLLYNLFGESQATKVWERHHGRKQAPSWLRTEDVSRDEFMAALGVGVNALFTSRSEGRRWIDQTPLYTRMVDDLAIMFPGATFVHILRDGREVVDSMSNFANKLRGRPDARRYVPAWAWDFDEACRTWTTWVDTAAQFCGRHPDRSVTVRNDHLERDPDLALDAVFQALAEEPEPGPAHYLRTHRTNSSFDRRDAGTATQTWDLQRRETFLREAGPTMVAQGLVTSNELFDWVNEGYAVGA